jgi:hypothetical protein
MTVYAMKEWAGCHDCALSNVQDRMPSFMHHIHLQLRASVPPW